MKSLTNTLHNDQINNEGVSEKIKVGIFSKPILGILMLSWLFFMTSCVAFVPTRGPGGHGGPGGHRGAGVHNMHNGPVGAEVHNGPGEHRR